MPLTENRNREEDRRRVRALKLVLNGNGMEADYDLPRYIFVTVPYAITNDVIRGEVIRQEWLIEYNEHTKQTTLRRPHAKTLDYVMVPNCLLGSAVVFLVYHAANVVYYYVQSMDLMEVVH